MDEEFQTCSSVQVGNSSPDIPEQPPKKVKNIYSKRRDCISLKKDLLKRVNKDEYSKTLIAYLHGSITKEFFDEKMSTILTTATAKIMHNELIRSILFNAHFTMTPPPNVEIPLPQLPIHLMKGNPSNVSASNSFVPNAANPISNFLDDKSNPDTKKNDNANIAYLEKARNSFLGQTNEFKPNTAFNMGHIPSIYQLTSRIENLVSEKKIDSVDSNAVILISQQLKDIIVTLLKTCLIFHQNKNVLKDNDADINSVQSDSEEQESQITVSEVLSAIETDPELYSFVSVPIRNKYYSLVNK
ncbi:hypothetical protein M9Y10_021821 [Tritrichomonas musculus]|uniref:Uncharacterized protein n=1 Tax=Tritrichomonas musculus TaxID=1915356 RepID=A0ABR2KRF7_9EUKA